MKHALYCGWCGQALNIHYEHGWANSIVSLEMMRRYRMCGCDASLDRKLPVRVIYECEDTGEVPATTVDITPVRR